MHDQQPIDAAVSPRPSRPRRPSLRRSSVFREWERTQGAGSRTVQLLENGFVREAAVSDDGLTTEVFRAAAQSYEEVGWLEPAAHAYTLANDRNGVAEIACRWLDAGLFEEAAIALARVGGPITPAMLDRYERACRTNGWFLHVTAAAFLSENL